jgi:hypothetical protein
LAPQRQYCSRPNNKPLSCRNNAKLKVHRNQYPPGCWKESFLKYSADTRFEELSIDPQTNQNNPNILQAEYESIIKNPRRSNLEKGEPNPQPKPQKDQTNANMGQKLTYKQPGLGAGNIDEDLPKIPDLEKTISNPEFWNKVQNQIQKMN